MSPARVSAVLSGCCNRFVGCFLNNIVNLSYMVTLHIVMPNIPMNWIV